MSNIEVSADVLFGGSDWHRPRWVVEKEKVNQKFTGFSFYGSEGKILAVKGTLHTSYGNSYYVRLSIPDNYPYQIPTVSLPNHNLESNCPHKFTSENICTMKADQWSSAMSIAYLIAKVAKWLNKYDYWKHNNVWPGKEQKH